MSHIFSIESKASQEWFCHKTDQPWDFASNNVRLNFLRLPPRLFFIHPANFVLIRCDANYTSLNLPNWGQKLVCAINFNWYSKYLISKPVLFYVFIEKKWPIICILYVFKESKQGYNLNTYLPCWHIIQLNKNIINKNKLGMQYRAI